IVIGMMIYMGIKGTSSFLNISVTTDLLLIGGGLATFIPLSLYINGTITIPAKSVGFLQFITPIMAFFLGIFTYKESFETHDAITFSLILTGVILYLLSLRRRGVSKKVSMRKE
ncbi:MAG: EamA family transporter RarD, partial [Spirochaetia bacterium]|nr:EamA family transporter RarD [Spirochaetia bacterium]